MDYQERITQLAEVEFPGCAVLFDDMPGNQFRFRIESSNGRMISKTYPLFKPAEIDAKSDDEVRALIRQTCGR